MTKILIFVTNHATLGTTDEANGTYAPELTHAVHHFDDAGIAYDIASIKGGAAPLYGEDAEGDTVNAAVLADTNFQEKIKNTLVATDLAVEDYAAIFYPGGFGLLSDLAENKDVAAMTAQLYKTGGIVGAVCHGPAGLLPIEIDGEPLLASKRVTGFTREEEVDFGTINNIPFLLEEALSRKAVRYEKVQPWGENVIVDGQVITGQNPASASRVGKEMVRALEK